MSEVPSDLRRLAPLDHSSVLGDVMLKAADEIERLRWELNELAAQAEWRAQEIERLQAELSEKTGELDECRRLLRTAVEKLDYPELASHWGGWCIVAKEVAGGE